MSGEARLERFIRTGVRPVRPRTEACEPLVGLRRVRQGCRSVTSSAPARHIPRKSRGPQPTLCSPSSRPLVGAA